MGHAVSALTKRFRAGTEKYVVSNAPRDDREAVHSLAVIQPVRHNGPWHQLCTLRFAVAGAHLQQ
jgi:hypothetical protein